MKMQTNFPLAYLWRREEFHNLILWMTKNGKRFLCDSLIFLLHLHHIKSGCNWGLDGDYNFKLINLNLILNKIIFILDNDDENVIK